MYGLQSNCIKYVSKAAGEKGIKRKTDTSCVHPSLHALFNVPCTANVHQAEILQEKKKGKKKEKKKKVIKS